MLYYIKNSLAMIITMYIIVINMLIEKVGIKDKIIEFNEKCKKALLV